MKSILRAATTVVVFGGASIAVNAQTYPEMTLRYASHINEQSWFAEADRYFAREIEERSGGAITVDITWGRALARRDEVIPLLASGVIDLASVETGQYLSQLPFLGMTNALPFVFDDMDVMMDIVREMYETNPVLQDELERNGIMSVFSRPLPDYRITCTDPIRTMADFEGRRMRAYGSFVPIMWDSLGAVSVNVSTNELYESLQRGVVDCAYLGYASLEPRRLHEPAPYVSDLSFAPINGFDVMVGTQTFNSWPLEVQELIMEVGRDASRAATEGVREAEQRSLEIMLADTGNDLVVFEEPEQLDATVPDMLDVWVAAMADFDLEDEARELADFVRQRLEEAETN